MVPLDAPTVGAARAKAELAYGPSAIDDLHRAAARLLAREGRLERCCEVLRATVDTEELRERIGNVVAAFPPTA